MQTPIASPTPPNQKKPYTEPQLVEHGTVHDLTQKKGGVPDADNGGSQFQDQG